MNIKQYIQAYTLTRSKVLKNYLVGNEDRLFLTDEHEDVRKLMKSNKKETRMFLYRINYFIALFFLIFIVFNIVSSFFLISELGAKAVLIGTGTSLLMLIFFCWLFIKPLTHLFALENKRKKKNIDIYRKFYSE